MQVRRETYPYEEALNKLLPNRDVGRPRWRLPRQSDFIGGNNPLHIGRPARAKISSGSFFNFEPPSVVFRGAARLLTMRYPVQISLLFYTSLLTAMVAQLATMTMHLGSSFAEANPAQAMAASIESSIGDIHQGLVASGSAIQARTISAIQTLEKDFSSTPKPAPVVIKPALDAQAQQQATAAQYQHQIEIAQAKRILARPHSAVEKNAQPYVDRILENPEALQSIHMMATAVPGVDPVAVTVNIAAETSAQANFPKVKYDGPQTPLQITKEQFRNLIVAYGEKYAANADPAYKHTYEKQIREVGYLAQFMEKSKNSKHIVILYDKYERETGLSAANLDSRLRRLWTDPNISGAMQLHSIAVDQTKLRHMLVKGAGLSLKQIEKSLGAHTEERCLHYLGLHDCFKAEKMILTGQGDKTVVGNIMSLDKAIANFPSGSKIATVESETVRQMFDRQIGRWGKSYAGFKACIQRREAEQTMVTLTSARPSATIASVQISQTFRPAS